MDKNGHDEKRVQTAENRDEDHAENERIRNITLQEMTTQGKLEMAMIPVMVIKSELRERLIWKSRLSDGTFEIELCLKLSLIETY